MRATQSTATSLSLEVAFSDKYRWSGDNKSCLKSLSIPVLALDHADTEAMGRLGGVLRLEGQAPPRLPQHGSHEDGHSAGLGDASQDFGAQDLKGGLHFRMSSECDFIYNEWR
jgi:hypothetical protein